MLEAENIDFILYTPVLEGLWKQYELWDGTYVITDLLDIHEAMLVSNKNKELLAEHSRKKAESEAKLKGRME